MTTANLKTQYRAKLKVKESFIYLFIYFQILRALKGVQSTPIQGILLWYT